MAAVANHPSTDSATQLATWVAEDPALRQEVANDPVGTLQRLARPLDADVWIYRIVVLLLGATILAVVIGAFILVVNKNNAQVPDALLALGSGALGALAGLLTPISRSK